MGKKDVEYLENLMKRNVEIKVRMWETKKRNVEIKKKNETRKLKRIE